MQQRLHYQTCGAVSCYPGGTVVHFIQLSLPLAECDWLVHLMHVATIDVLSTQLIKLDKDALPLILEKPGRMLSLALPLHI